MGNHPIQPTAGVAVTQRRSSNVGRTSAFQTRDHQEGPSPNTQGRSGLSPLLCAGPWNRSSLQRIRKSLQVANKVSGQSIQEEIVNSIAMDDIFVAFTMMQQIMTGLSSAASQEKKFSIITKSVFSLLKRNGGYSS
jgi:hypothetical protein